MLLYKGRIWPQHSTISTAVLTDNWIFCVAVMELLKASLSVACGEKNQQKNLATSTWITHTAKSLEKQINNVSFKKDKNKRVYYITMYTVTISTHLPTECSWPCLSPSACPSEGQREEARDWHAQGKDRRKQTCKGENGRVGDREGEP